MAVSDPQTSLTFVDPPAPVLCTGYNCQLDRSGDVRCDGAVCDCLGTDGNCLALNPILDDVLGATIICSELPGDDCTVELPGSAVDPFTATCW